MLTPPSNAARDVAPRISEARFGLVPRIYIAALKGRSLVPAVQRKMQELVPWASVRHMDIGHARMLADPGGLSDLLLTSIAELEATAA